MGLNLKSFFSSQFLLLIMAILLMSGCASIQKPQGGPRDRTPPKLLLATPMNPTRNFKGQTIKLDFDEYFKFMNQFQEITISPALEKPLDLKIRQKSLVINIKDTLTKNTTYVINFGKGIADVNESNVMKNFTYVFSTGPHIDSLSISGQVTDNQTTEKVKDATVMLFPVAQDTLFGKKKPAIYTTTDSSGTFNLANLHDGDYRIYALKELAPNKIYDKDDELIAFSKDPIHLTKDTSNIKLSVFKQTPEKFRVIDRHFDPDGKMVFIFNKPLIAPVLKINYPAALDEQKIVDFSKTRDTAMLYLKNTNFDSISVSFIDKGVILDTVTRTKSAKETYERILNLTYNLSYDNKLKPNTDLLITAGQPIESIDASRIILLEDSVAKGGFTLTKDPANPKKLTFKYKWKQGAKYNLAFNEGTFTNIYGDKNKRLPRIFSIDKPENYGLLILTVSIADTAKSYVVELLNAAKQVIRTDVIKKTTAINYKDFAAGKYTVRVVYDDNNNGQWDSGNVKKGLYPEYIFVVPKTYSIRPNIDAEETAEIPREPRQ